MPNEVKAYRCQYCGKLYMQRYTCKKHENECTHNIKCLKCVYYEKFTIDHENPKPAICNARKNLPMQTPKGKRKGIFKKNNTTYREGYFRRVVSTMPSKCRFFEKIEVFEMEYDYRNGILIEV